MHLLEDRLAQYTQRQWLSAERASYDTVALAHHLVGIQAQIPTTSSIAAFARLASVSSLDMKHGLEVSRRLVRTWTIRGTMHVVDAEDLPMLWAALQPEWESRWSRYLDNHVTKSQRNEVAQAAMAVLAEGPASRAELERRVRQHLGVRESWVSHLFSSWGGVLKDLAYAGLAVHGPAQNRETLFVRVQDWLHLIPYSGSADEALGEILVRYVNSYGPATLRDFVYWSGVNMQRCKKARALVTDRIRMEDGYMLPPDNTPARTPALVRLLPKFDPYIMAHSTKFFLPKDLRTAVFRQAADVASVVLIRGAVAGTWRFEGAGGKRRIRVQVDCDLSSDEAESLQVEAETLRSWLAQHA